MYLLYASEVLKWSINCVIGIPVEPVPTVTLKGSLLLFLCSEMCFSSMDKEYYWPLQPILRSYFLTVKSVSFTVHFSI